MASYTDKPWLQMYKLGAFKLKKTLHYPAKPLFSILDDAAEQFPNRDVYHYLGRRMKFRELKTQVEKLASAFVHLGIKKGDTVIVYLPNCPQFIISDFAVLKTGAVLVPCSPLLKETKLKDIAEESKAGTIICMEKNCDMVKAIQKSTGIKHVIVTSIQDYSSSESKDINEIPDTYHFRKLISEHEPAVLDVNINPHEDLAILAFTGGSTGVPKGVMLTHHQRLSNIMQGLPWMMAPLPNLKGTASSLLAVPVFHAMGHYLMQSCVFWAIKIFLIPDSRNTKGIVDIMNEFRPFLIFMVPTQLLRLARPRVKIKRMPVLVMSGSAPLPEEVALRLEQKIRMPVSESYGLTETGPCTHINISGLAKVTRFASSTIPGIGIPVPDTEAKIVDPVSKKEVTFGDVGELWIRGPQVMKGYWPEPGSGLEPDGWFRTGDLGKMDEKGYFFIVDRIKDMINVSGMKVYSIEIDEVLFKHPAVLAVVSIGVPDPKRPGSERIKAFIQLRDEFKGNVSEEEIITYCKEKLAAYAIPKAIEFRDDLPFTVTEKLFKRALREEEIKKMKERGEL